MSPQKNQKKGENDGTYINLVYKITYKRRLNKIEWLASYHDIGPVVFEDSTNFFTCFCYIIQIQAKKNKYDKKLGSLWGAF